MQILATHNLDQDQLKQALDSTLEVIGSKAYIMIESHNDFLFSDVIKNTTLQLGFETRAVSGRLFNVNGELYFRRLTNGIFGARLIIETEYELDKFNDWAPYEYREPDILDKHSQRTVQLDLKDHYTYITTSSYSSFPQSLQGQNGRIIIQYRIYEDKSDGSILFWRCTGVRRQIDGIESK